MSIKYMDNNGKEVKRCYSCKEIKEVQFFGASPANKDGLCGSCLECKRKYNKNNYELHKEERQKYNKEHAHKYKDKRDEYRRSHLDEMDVYRQSHKDYFRNHWLVSKYGISLEEYDTILLTQGNGCAICGGNNNNGKSLVVDHDHKTGLVRGLLCIKCNTTLGNVNDDESILEKMISYLRGENGTI